MGKEHRSERQGELGVGRPPGRLTLDGGRRGIIGVETKYHEHCKVEAVPSDSRIRRYRHVATKAGVFESSALDELVGTALQHIWLDHLLALSMLQDPRESWDWVKFVLVDPERNPSFSRAARTYRTLLADPSTFEARTVESMLDTAVLAREFTEAFRTRYLW